MSDLKQRERFARYEARVLKALVLRTPVLPAAAKWRKKEDQYALKVGKMPERTLAKMVLDSRGLLPVGAVDVTRYINIEGSDLKMIYTSFHSAVADLPICEILGGNDIGVFFAERFNFDTLTQIHYRLPTYKVLRLGICL